MTDTELDQQSSAMIIQAAHTYAMSQAALLETELVRLIASGELCMEPDAPWLKPIPPERTQFPRRESVYLHILACTVRMVAALDGGCHASIQLHEDLEQALEDMVERVDPGFPEKALRAWVFDLWTEAMDAFELADYWVEPSILNNTGETPEAMQKEILKKYGSPDS